MVHVVSGPLGGGKSLDTVREMVFHLCAGGCVATNITLSPVEVGRYMGRRLSSRQYTRLDPTVDPRVIPTGDRRGRGKRRVMVVLDEALNWFQSSASRDSSRDTWGEWLRQSDKLGQDVYFIAQQFGRAAKWIRELALVNIDIVPLKTITFLHIPLGRIWPLSRTYCRRVVDVRTMRVMRFDFRVYSSRWWRFYDTAETYGFQGAASAYDCLGEVWPAHVPCVWPVLACAVPPAVMAALV